MIQQGDGEDAAAGREPALSPTPPPAGSGAPSPRVGAWALLWRGLRLRCPVCGRGPLFARGLTPHARCSNCGFYFARDNEYGQEGYFTGAMAINLVLTGVIPLVVVLVLALTRPVPVPVLMAAGIAWTILFPILFYRHACALWIVIDHLLNPPTAAERAGERTVGPTASPLADRRRREGR
jgi:uncharacterized protein (DUF983 family)